MGVSVSVGCNLTSNPVGPAVQSNLLVYMMLPIALGTVCYTIGYSLSPLIRM